MLLVTTGLSIRFNRSSRVCDKSTIANFVLQRLERIPFAGRSSWYSSYGVTTTVQYFDFSINSKSCIFAFTFERNLVREK
jgi:hypothetical protein